MTEREATNNLVLESEPPQSFISGLSIPGTEYEENAAKLLQVARADGYDFCVTALALPSSDGNVDDEHYPAAYRRFSFSSIEALAAWTKSRQCI